MEQYPSSENLRTLDKIKDYVTQGYILHGSKRRLEKIDPQQASDNDKERTEGNLHAVYGTTDYRIPIAMALLDTKDPSKGRRAFYSTDNDETMRIGGENVAFTPGFVYILPKDTFQEIHGVRGTEIVSFEPVTPVETIEVGPDILKLIPGIIYEIRN